jgi:hypothetical protein
MYLCVQVLGLSSHHEDLVIPTPDSLETDVQHIAAAVKSVLFHSKFIVVSHSSLFSYLAQFK